MASIDRLWLATLTKGADDAGTDARRLDLTINVDGDDVVDQGFFFLGGSGLLSSGLGPDSAWLSERQAAISDTTLATPIESSFLTNSSVRLGIRSDDAWGPRHALLLGHAGRQVIALAMETDLGPWMSTDPSEGKLTIPLRLVGAGSSSTPIRRVLLLVYTGSGIDAETDDAIELEIVAGGNLVLKQTVADTPQDDLEPYMANWYFLDASVPFTRGDVLSDGHVRLRIHGTDAFRPASVFVYGLDTAQGRPSQLVHLVSIPEWNLGVLSTDPGEGQSFVDLPVV